MMRLKLFSFMFVIGMLVSPLAAADGRQVSVILESPLLPNEGVALKFIKSGHVLEMERSSAREFTSFFQDELIGQTFQVYRTPAGVVEVGFRGQGVPPRTTASVEGPHWIFPVAWADRLPPSDGNTIKGTLVEEVISDSPRISGERTLRILLPDGYEK